MWKIFIPIIFFASISASGGDFPNWSPEHKKLFELVKIPQFPGMPLTTENIKKLRMSLSVEVLSQLNKSTSFEAKCLLENVAGEEITIRHLNEISEMLERLAYYESGFIPCKSTKEILNSEELEEITKMLWQSKLLKNEYPSGNCRGRAFLTSKLLDDYGVKSKTISLNGNIYGSYEVKNGFKIASYYEHFANIVEVNQNGKIEKFVIDPMFTSKPILLDDYLTLISPAALNSPIKFEIKHQTYADKLDPPLKDETCQYNVNLLKDYEEALKDSIDNPSGFQGPNTVYKSRIEAIDKSVQQLLDFNH